MTEEIKLLLALLVGVYLLTRRVNTWRAARALNGVVRTLEQAGAVDPASAIRLSRAEAGWASMGVLDFRPRAVQALLANGVVEKTPDGLYYLNIGAAGKADASWFWRPYPRRWTTDNPEDPDCAIFIRDVLG